MFGLESREYQDGDLTNARKYIELGVLNDDGTMFYAAIELLSGLVGKKAYETAVRLVIAYERVQEMAEKT